MSVAPRASDPQWPIGLVVWGASRLGGAERRFFRLFNFMAGQGQDIHLFTSGAGAIACEALGIRLTGRKVHFLDSDAASKSRLSSHWAAISWVLALVRTVRREKIRHLHFGQNPGAQTFLYALLSRFACPFSVSLVDSVKDYQRNRRERMYARVTFRHCTKVDCLSEQIRSDALEFTGRKDPQKFRVAPCSFTEPRPPVAGIARDIDVSLISRMVSRKGHMLLKEALVMLADAGLRGIVVHVCGSGPLEAQLRKEFAAIEGQQVHVHFEKDPFGILARSKVSLSLQDIENYPSQSLLEAMTCECAIVATDVGLTRLLLDETCAILIPADPAALAKALRRLLENETLRVELGRKAREVVTTKHTIERFAQYLATDLFGIR